MAAGITTILPVFLRDAGAREISELERAVQSALTQECELPHEVLVVDDGSQPAVRLKEHPQVRTLRLPRNCGISYALNAGLTQARYDLIARIDADDFWRPGKMRRQLQMLQADAELTLVGSGMRLVHTGRPELDRDEVRSGEWSETLALTKRIGCPFPHGSILGRRDVFEILGGYPQAAVFQHGEDYALWAQWMRFFSVAICEEVFLEYNVSERQISSRYVDEQRTASEAAWQVLGVCEGLVKIPSVLKSLADGLGLSLFETSVALFTAWKFYEYVLVDEEQFEDVAALLPDRAVHRLEDERKLLANRFFYLTKKKRTASLRSRFR